MNEIQLQIKKSSRVLDILFNILRIATYVGFGILAASIIYVLCAGAGWVGNIHIQSGIIMDGQALNSWEALRAHLPELGNIVTRMVLLLLVFIRIGAMFHDIRETASPFTEANVSRIQFSSYVLLTVAVLPNLVELVLAFIVTKEGAVTELVNFEVLAIAFVLLALARIFTYGAMLQRQEDETL